MCLASVDFLGGTVILAVFSLHRTPYGGAGSPCHVSPQDTYRWKLLIQLYLGGINLNPGLAGKSVQENKILIVWRLLFPVE